MRCWQRFDGRSAYDEERYILGDGYLFGVELPHEAVEAAAKVALQMLLIAARPWLGADDLF
eukprot:4879963-Prymnesium_polylepis.1